MKRRCGLFWGIVLALLLVPGVLRAEESARDWFERGYYLEHGVKKLDEAIDAYRQAVRLAGRANPELAGQAMIRMAVCERSRGREMEARRLLNEAIERFGQKAASVRESAKKLLESEDAVRRSLRIYDIEYLSRAIEDYAPEARPELPPNPQGHYAGGGGGGRGGVLTFGEETPEGMRIGPDELIDLIMTNIAEDSWQNDRNRVSVEEGYRLVVVQTPEVHEAIDRYLARLRALRGRLITFDMSLLLLEGETLEEIVEQGAGLFPIEEDAESFDEAVEDGRIRVLEKHRLTAYNRQWVNVAPLRVRRFLSDYEVNQTGVTPVVSPVVETVRAGTVLEIRPTLVGDGSRMILEFQGTLGDVPLNPRRKVKTVQGTIDLPEMDLSRIQSVLFGESGRTVMVGGIRTSRFEDAGMKDPRLVFLVTPRIGVVKTGDDEESRERRKRYLRVYNVSLLTQRARLTPVQGDGFGKRAFIFQEDDEPRFEPLSPHVLRDLIVDNISPDSWHNELNKLDVSPSGEMVVVQTPAVHNRIESFLKSLRRERGQMLTVEAYRFFLEPDELKKLLARGEEMESGGFVLSQKDLNVLTGEGREEKPDFNWMAVTCRNGEAVRVLETRRTRYLADYERASGGTAENFAVVTDPIVDVTVEGVGLDVRPKLLPDGETVSVALEYTAQRFDGMSEADTSHGVIELPAGTDQRVRAHLTFPLDRLLLVGAATGDEASERGVILLRVRSRNLFEKE